MNLNKVHVKESGLAIGLGVFASTQVAPEEIIEQCPIIKIPAKQVPGLKQSVFFDYYYSWDGKDAALALGYGSLYNHSYTPNAQYIRNIENKTIDMIALSAIEAGEEIFVNYNGDPNSKDELWFTPVISKSRN